MTLHINEAEVRSVLTMAMALKTVEENLRKQARGEVVVQPRRRFELPKGFYHYMAAADYAGGYVAEKQYTYVAGKIRFLVLLYEMATGDLVAQIEADYMGQVRTGAASGVATKFMARRDARVAAIIGTGGQARTQLEAIAGVRKLELARAYGRDVSRREKFCADMAERLSIPVYAAASAAQAIKGADIICTATTASQPVVTGQDIAPSMHINAIGVNHAHKQEIDEAVVSRADLIAVDSIEQSRQEAGDLIVAFGQDESKWSSVKMLADIVDGKIPGRSNDTAVTLFKSNGIASWDLAVAVRVLALAREKGLGRTLPLWANK
ncbi:MAG TPA: ornithine cyclodeaminase family protein [Verrucomicrobiae bacterium]|nr:ornithine cyclodeaminase family protein [Verrucomicrobiae bacterium]